MKIRINRISNCADNELAGKIFDIKSEDGGYYKIKDNEGYYWNILKSDCTVIPDTLTNAEQAEIIRKVRELLRKCKKDGDRMGLCPAVKHVSKYHLSDIPALLKYKPKILYSTRFVETWFDLNDIDTRLAICDKALADLAESDKLEGDKTAKLTKEQKIRFCKLAIDNLQKYPKDCICGSLIQQDGFPTSQASEVFDFIPEIEKYKPSPNLDRGDYWFSREAGNNLKRIEILNRVVADLEGDDIKAFAVFELLKDLPLVQDGKIMTIPAGTKIKEVPIDGLYCGEIATKYLWQSNLFKGERAIGKKLVKDNPEFFRELYPDKFEEDKSVEVGKFPTYSNGLVRIERGNGCSEANAGKYFWLMGNVDWKLIKNSSEQYYLIPTKK